MRSILFLSDTVNRRFMDLYNASGVHLPNLERLVKRSVVFTNHWVGSAPCMPARRDLLTGRLNFLERKWGPIEAFDHTLPQILHNRGIRSHMITDHYHYHEIGGENYCQMFDSWEMIRGQEWDPWVTMVKKKEIPEHYGKIVPQYWYNRERFAAEEEKYPSVVTIQKAAEWLETYHDQDDFLLWIEPFDPHEPYEVPQKYLDMVEDHYKGKLFLWPEYMPVKEQGVPEDALEHVKKRYMALLLMVDHWMGRILDVMDRHQMWEDTMFIYTTDHGCMLGEHGYLAKNYMPAYNEVFHIPLVVHMPKDEGAGKRIGCLTQNIDVMPTLLEFYGISEAECINKIHGKSWLPLIRGEKEKIRDCVIYGYFGKQINITDGRYTYFKAPVDSNRPLNLYTSVPTDYDTYFNHTRIKDYSMIDAGPYLNWTDYPVYRIPADAINDQDTGDGSLRFVYLREWEKVDRLFDLENDYAQEHNLIRELPEVVHELDSMMKQAMLEHDAPAEQFIRMNL